MPKERASRIQEGVGRRIAEERHARNWTQQELADRLKIEVQSLQRFERGEIATIATIVKVANMLGVTTRSLFDKPASRRRPTGRPSRAGT